MKKKHFYNIHWMRLIACLAVVIIHITATPISLPIALTPLKALFYVVNKLATPAVPIFIFISGFLLYNPERPIHSLGDFYRKRLPKLIIFYALWSFIYWMIYVVRGNYPLSLIFYIKNLFTGETLYHLYFMVIIIQLYLLYPLFEKIIISLGLNTFVFLSGLITASTLVIRYPMADRLFPTYLLFFALGVLLRAKRKVIKPKYLGLLTGISFIAYISQFFYVEIYGDFLPALLTQMSYIIFCSLACVNLFYFTKSLPIVISPWFFRLSRSTMEIYYAHPIGLMISAYFIKRLQIQSISLSALLSLAIVVIMIVPLSYILEPYIDLFTKRLLSKA